MKHSTQQMKPVLSFYKRASLVLLVFLMVLKINAQNFYYEKGTDVTIRENTIFYIKDSGTISQAKLRDFEGQNIAQRQALNETKQVAFNDKKSKILSGKIKKDSLSKSLKEKAENYPKVEPIEFVKICPDNFFSSGLKGLAISVSIPLQYNLKFLIENIRLKSIQGYSINTNNEIINDGLIFFKDYHLSFYTTRPPPFEFYI